MTEKQRDIIRENVADSRRLGVRADKAADKVVRGLRSAAAARRAGGRYRPVSAARES